MLLLSIEIYLIYNNYNYLTISPLVTNFYKTFNIIDIISESLVFKAANYIKI